MMPLKNPEMFLCLETFYHDRSLNTLKINILRKTSGPQLKLNEKPNQI